VNRDRILCGPVVRRMMVIGLKDVCMAYELDYKEMDLGKLEGSR